ncbi:cytochrome b ascorbate-dependent protein 3 [Podospora australis]|uniref:Cytochrome b ascorbate-dependent protein 3 n=1 Tax=Podospora australis TaxID=1536484 RepID=A0AAN6WXJ0_9PEZI|nr:cytochrome b ascorbate-dependent protein 3 [Podospora australis]
MPPADHIPSPALVPHDNNVEAAPAPTESEPLLGRPGDAVQKPHDPMFRNLYLGTGWLAQLGVLLLLISTWIAVFRNPTLPLVSPHPLLQSLGVFLLVQAILILQPTTHANPTAKKNGARLHASLQGVSFLLFLAGIAVIETNKHKNGYAHFHSTHAYLGVITGVVLLVQYLFGFTIYVTPVVWGGEDKAKQLWKYHRYVGYLLLLLLLATTSSALWTDYVQSSLGIPLLTFPVASVLIVLGVFPRAQLSKLGLQRH